MKLHILKSLSRLFGKGCLIFFIFSILIVLVLKWIPVCYFPLMLVRSIQNVGNEKYETRKQWCSLDNISPEIVKAVVASEDNRFFEHHGFDINQILRAVKENKTRKRERGASTISQQTAKNVFTFHSHTWFRKGIESYFTVLIEAIWGKKRIMEVYLNIAELGNGIFGVEAASQFYFNKPAKKITRREACLFAACLPSPLKRNPAKPGSYTSKRATDVSKLILKLHFPDWINELN